MTPPSNEEQIIEQKLKELAALSEQQEKIQTKMIKIEAAIRAFIALVEDEATQFGYTMKLRMATHPTGLTEAIKRVMINAQTETLEPTAVRRRLEEAGFTLSGYANPLAVIHTTLMRLEQQKLVKSIKDGYRWSGTMYGLDAESRPRIVMRPPRGLR